MSDLGPEYAANERRFYAAGHCLDRLEVARRFAPPAVREHLDKAIAAAEGARAGYDFRDSELYIEATKGRES